MEEGDFQKEQSTGQSGQSSKQGLAAVKKVLGWIKAYPAIIVLVLVILLQFVPNGQGTYPWGGIWMRMQVKELPITQDWAQNAVHNFVREQIKQEVNQQYPNLPDENKLTVVDEKFQKFLDENKAEIDQQIVSTRKELLAHFQYEADKQSFLYMPDIDPYFYLRHARNLLETGQAYDELKDGVPWDNHLLAPEGKSLETALGGSITHPRVLLYLYKIASVFTKTTLMNAACYFPIVLIFLSLILAFLIGRRVGGNVGAFFAVTALAILPTIISRTPWGHADTDAYNVFFPLLIIWLSFEALEAKKFFNKILFAIIGGLAVGIYSITWKAWWFTFDLVIGALIVYWLSLLFINRKGLFKGIGKFWKEKHSFRSATLLILMFLICSGIFVSLFTSPGNFISAPLQPFSFTTIKSAAHQTLWPNVYTTVAELNPASFSKAVAAVGGKLMFLVAALGILLLFLKRDKQGTRDIKYAVLLTIWFIGSIYATIKGIRFALLLGPAFAIAFAAGTGLVTQKIGSWAKRSLNINKIVSYAIIIIIFAVIIINPTKAGVDPVRESWDSVKNDVPIMNDAWWNVLTQIKEKSAPDAIVNSWWDFGHHFKYVADRAVTFDGACQNTPQAHWIGRVLQTDNEELAVGILRMLDCGANSAFDTLLEETKDPVKSVDLLYKILVLDRDSAQTVLEEEGITASVLKFTHCDPPEDYFITSEDMVRKAGVWAHFGTWDFKRADIWMNLRKLPEDKAVAQMISRFNYSEEQASTLYNKANELDTEEEANTWISSWPTFITTPADCTVKDDLAKCGNIVLNITSKYAEVKFDQGVGIPRSIVYFNKEGELVEHSLEKSTGPFSVLLIPKRDGMKAMLLAPELAKSMFTRLFYLKGQGLKHFRLFAQDHQLVGGDIFVWTVDWKGSEPYMPPELLPKDAVSSGDKIAVNYIGWLDTGEVFDSSIPGWKEKNITKTASFDDYSTQPLEFVAGKSQVVPGFDEAVIGTKLNETKTITIPPEKAYGTDPEAHFLGNKTLHFKLRVEKII